MSILKSKASRFAGASLAAGVLAMSGVGIAHAAEDNASSSTDVVVSPTPTADTTAPAEDTTTTAPVDDTTTVDPAPVTDSPTEEAPVTESPAPAPDPTSPTEDTPVVDSPTPVPSIPAVPSVPAVPPATDQPTEEAPAPVPSPVPTNAPGNSGEHRAALPQQALDNNQSHKNDGNKTEAQSSASVKAENKGGRG